GRRRPLSALGKYAATLLLLGVAGCAGLPGSGPTAAEVTAAAKPTSNGEVRFALVDVDPNVVAAMEHWSAASLQGTFGALRPPTVQCIGIGDQVQIAVWESSAGGLFTVPVNDRIGTGSRSAIIPEQVVGGDGSITMPFAGRVQVAGRTPH